MGRRSGLFGVEGFFACPIGGARFDARQKQRIQQLRGDDVERSPQSLGDLRRGHSVRQVKMSRDRSRQEKLSRKEIHLNLPPLAPAIIDNAIDTDRRRFGGGRSGLLSCFGVSMSLTCR
jgi:hypothetical protein